MKTTVGTAALLVAAVYVIAPIYWLVVASAKSTSQLFSTSTFLPPAHLNWITNLKSLFSYNSGDFKWWFVNSVIYAVATATLATGVSTLCGYGLAKYRFKLRGAIFGLVVGALIVPATALVVPLFLLEHDVGLTNTYQGVILPLMVYPFGVHFMSIFAADAVPDTLIDSCRIDGAGEFHTFWMIGRPILMPGHGDALSPFLHRDLEQLLPPAGPARHRNALPPHRRPGRLGQRPQPRRGRSTALPRSDTRLSGFGPADAHPVPVLAKVRGPGSHAGGDRR
jgi:ABC-type spermidine/putrescine transport system permease subunit II